MSQAADLISEVKASLAKATAGVKRFEGEMGEIGQYTDLAHLNIAAIHLREFIASLEHQSNQPDEQPVAGSATGGPVVAPAGILSAETGPETIVATNPNPDLQDAAVEPAPGDPVDDLVAAPKAAAKP